MDYELRLIFDIFVFSKKGYYRKNVEIRERNMAGQSNFREKSKWIFCFYQNFIWTIRAYMVDTSI